MSEFKEGFIYQPKIVNGSKITIGKERALTIMLDKHFNKFQKMMIKWCFGFTVEDYSECEAYEKNLKKNIKIGDIVTWHPFKDYEHIVLSNEFEGKVIGMDINTDYVGHAPIDELECTGKTGQIKIEIDTEENNG